MDEKRPRTASRIASPLAAMAAELQQAVAQMRHELHALRQELDLTASQGARTASSVDELRPLTDNALAELRAMVDGNRRGEPALHLIDLKTLQVPIFSGARNESFKTWTKKFKAFCNARRAGFREAVGRDV